MIRITGGTQQRCTATRCLRRTVYADEFVDDGLDRFDGGAGYGYGVGDDGGRAGAKVGVNDRQVLQMNKRDHGNKDEDGEGRVECK